MATGTGVQDATPGAPTPPQEEQANAAYANYVPHDLPYDTAFEDAIMEVMLSSASKQHDIGIRVIPDDSEDQPVQGVSIRAHDISLQSLPIIAESELPLALDDGRRQFSSTVPGIKLTHPGGYLEGGPGLDPDMDTFPEDFFQNHASVHTLADLHEAVRAELQNQQELLKKRMRNRQRAKEKNERIQKELKTMSAVNEMELKIHRKQADERRAKKEAREKRKAEKGV